MYLTKFSRAEHEARCMKTLRVALCITFWWTTVKESSSYHNCGARCEHRSCMITQSHFIISKETRKYWQNFSLVAIWQQWCITFTVKGSCHLELVSHGHTLFCAGHYQLEMKCLHVRLALDHVHQCFDLHWHPFLNIF